LVALLRGRARLGALTLAYPHTPPFPSWGRFEECAHTSHPVCLRAMAGARKKAINREMPYKSHNFSYFLKYKN
jgi:hypothetical protein